jgi:TetR/AcrR family transcriptional regulator, tetracycline repressor protein
MNVRRVGQTGGSRRRAGRPGPGRKTLSRDRILEAALRLVDAEGIDALSMRRLAADLGVNPMSIYHHVSGKDALIAGLVEAVFSEARPPTPDEGTWQERVRQSARVYRRLVRAHPNLVLALLADAAAVSVGIIQIAEPVYAALDDAGLSPLIAAHAADTVADFVHGFVLGEVANPSGQWDIGPELLSRTDGHQAARVPTMRRIFESLAEQGAQYDYEAAFEAGLDILVRGIEGLAADARAGDADRSDLAS